MLASAVVFTAISASALVLAEANGSPGLRWLKMLAVAPGSVNRLIGLPLY